MSGQYQVRRFPGTNLEMNHILVEEGSVDEDVRLDDEAWDESCQGSPSPQAWLKLRNKASTAHQRTEPSAGRESRAEDK